MKKLNKAAERITMPTELKERILAECRNLPRDESMEAEHVFKVEHVRKKPIGRIITAVAACAVLGAGIGAAGMKFARDDRMTSSDITSESTESTEYGETAPFGDLRTDHLSRILVSVPNDDGGAATRDTRRISDEQHQRLGDLFNSYEWVLNEKLCAMEWDDAVEFTGVQVCYMEFEEQPDPEVKRCIRIYANDVLTCIDPETKNEICYNVDSRLFTEEIYNILNDLPANDPNATDLENDGLAIGHLDLDAQNEKSIRKLLNGLPAVACDISEYPPATDPTYLPGYEFSGTLADGSGQIKIELYKDGYMICHVNENDTYCYRIDYETAYLQLEELLNGRELTDGETMLIGTSDEIAAIDPHSNDMTFAETICYTLNTIPVKPITKIEADKMLCDMPSSLMFSGTRQTGERAQIDIYDIGIMTYSWSDEYPSYDVHFNYYAIDYSALYAEVRDAFIVENSHRRGYFHGYRGIAEGELSMDSMVELSFVLNSYYTPYTADTAPGDHQPLDEKEKLQIDFEIYGDDGNIEETRTLVLYANNDFFSVRSIGVNGEYLSDRTHETVGTLMRGDILSAIDPAWSGTPFRTLFKMTDKLFISADTSRFAVDTSYFDLMVPDSGYDLKAVLNDDQAKALSYAFWGWSWNWEDSMPLDEVPALDSPVLVIDTNCSSSEADMPGHLYIYDDGTVITANDYNGTPYNFTMYENVDNGTGDLVRTLLDSLS